MTMISLFLLLPLCVAVTTSFLHPTPEGVQSDVKRYAYRADLGKKWTSEVGSRDHAKRIYAFRADLGKRVRITRQADDNMERLAAKTAAVAVAGEGTGTAMYWRKRPAFRADLGKRDVDGEDDSLYDAEQLLENEKRYRSSSFRSDLGKRRTGSAFRADLGKRRVGSALRADLGKRDINEDETDEYLDDYFSPGDDIDNETAEKRRYRADLGKRPNFRADLGKRPAFRADLGRRAAFRSDLGKRPAFRSDLGKRPAFRSDLGKRAAFRTDLGKRPQFRTDLGK